MTITDLTPVRAVAASSYLHIREVGLEGVGAGVAGVEEHELGLLQVAGGQSLLGVRMRPVKAFLPHWCVKVEHPWW